VDEIDAMPQAIVDNALGGDVVMCMGAGSIGQVPARVAEMLDAADLSKTAGARA
jgi:UDP-N-acetylmuramate--alanine ligase